MLFIYLFVFLGCDVCYVPVDQAVTYMPDSPSESPILENLTYYHARTPFQRKEMANGVKLVGSDFGGYHSLMLRNMSYDIQKSMIVPCGYEILTFKNLEYFFVS